MSGASPLRPEDPSRLGAYTLLGRLGQGGQGVVFLGEDEAGGRVAVKLLQAFLGEGDPARTRFVRELATAKRVARFCTAQVLDADIAGDRPYIVSEYVQGPSLADQVAEHGPLDGSALERLAVGTATALAAIHQAGIVHRDFKPGNVLLGGDGPRVIDFGVAKALDPGSTGSSAVVGTPSYMAPEQVGAEPVGPPADVWAWAATMVYAATGSTPFGSDTIPAVMGRILQGEPALGRTPEPLRALVAAALAKNPAARPAAADLLMRLIGHGGEVPDIMAEGRTLAAARGAAPATGTWTRSYGAPGTPGTPGHAPTLAQGAPGPPGAPAGPPPGRPPAPARRRSWALPVAVAAAAVLIGGGVGAWALLRDGDSGKPAPSASAAGSGSRKAEESPAGSAEPAEPRLVVSPAGSVTLPPNADSVEVSLAAEGGDVEWTAEEVTSISGGKLLSLSRSQGRVTKGETVKIRVTAQVGSPRKQGERTVRFRSDGTPDQDLTVNWS